MKDVTQVLNSLKEIEQQLKECHKAIMVLIGVCLRLADGQDVGTWPEMPTTIRELP